MVTWQQIGQGEPNPFDVTYTTNSPYSASYGEFVITEGSQVDLPSPSANEAVAVRSFEQTVTITTPSGNIRDSSTTGKVDLNSPKYVILVSDGTNWYVQNNESGIDPAIPDPVTDWTTAGDGGFTISTGDPLSVSHDSEGAGDAGGMASEYVVDLDGKFSGEIIDVEFRNVNFEQNSNGSNHLMIGLGDISPDQPARINGNGIYYGSEVSGGDDALHLVENGSENRYVISPVDWSSTHDVTVRVDDTASSTAAELIVDESSLTSRTDMFQSDLTVIFQLINNDDLSNSCDIDEVGVVKQ